MTNTYYENCFKQDLFKSLFFKTLNTESVIAAIMTKCKRQFVKRVDEWIVTLEDNLTLRESSPLLNSSKNTHLGDIKHIRMATSREEIDEARRLFLAYL